VEFQRDGVLAGAQRLSWKDEVAVDLADRDLDAVHLRSEHHAGAVGRVVEHERLGRVLQREPDQLAARDRLRLQRRDREREVVPEIRHARRARRRERVAHAEIGIELHLRRLHHQTRTRERQHQPHRRDHTLWRQLSHDSQEIRSSGVHEVIGVIRGNVARNHPC
jgi:hypothetical protein